MAPSDAWLARQNAALKLRAHGVTLEVSQGRQPLERHRLGIEAFNWTPWLPKRRGRPKGAARSGPQPESISGRQAIRTTHDWWEQQRRRGPSAKDSWKVDYEAPLALLQEISSLEPAHLVALVEATPAGSRSRRRASQAAGTVARALDWPAALVSQLRELGEGYSAARSQVPRDLPKEREIEALIDRLSNRWQWPVAVAATYGCLPHEALLFAEVQASGLLRIADGKTGAWQSIADGAQPGSTQQRLPALVRCPRDGVSAG